MFPAQRPTDKDSGILILYSLLFVMTENVFFVSLNIVIKQILFVFYTYTFQVYEMLVLIYFCEPFCLCVFVVSTAVVVDISDCKLGFV